VLNAGECAGYLTEEGAKLLDVSGTLKAGAKVAPPEGDAGTGMTATNSVRVGTGNVSAGTSVFAMVVTEKTPKLHKEINVVTTPDGAPVAMVHCSNCTSDFNAWAGMFKDFSEALGVNIPMGKLMDLMFEKALSGKPDCDGLISYNYYSGEANVGLTKGIPVLMRKPDADFSFANLMRTHLYSCLATLKMGLDILIKEENIRIDRICGHGGYFKAPVTGPKFLSAAVGAPVITMESSGEGGPYGMALLAAYSAEKGENETLENYLSEKVFKNVQGSTVMPDDADVAGFETYTQNFKKLVEVEKAAIENV
jgi:sugar (pentulose or hexulose) kinase